MNQYRTFAGFYELCSETETIFENRWKQADEISRRLGLEREKRAILGWEEDMEYYRSQIRDILDDMPESRAVRCPPWYKSLADGIFAELYRLAGLEPWIYN